MKTRIGMLSDTKRSDITALSFGVANAASRNPNRRRRLVPVPLMMSDLPPPPGGRVSSSPPACPSDARPTGCRPRRTSRFPTRPSGLQLPTLEFLLSRPEVAEMVHRGPRRRERERLELLVEHLLQVILGGDPDRDVWIEFLAARVRHVARHV